MDTIVAFSGGSLPCAIGIIRLSGDDAFGILNKIFLSKEAFYHKKMIYGSALARDKSVIDLCLAVTFSSPKSYTGEDMAEIYCHGSQAVVDELLKSAQQEGARLAEAGEFTKRAFLNGKLDLTSAEAVGDLIHSTGISQAKAAINQLKGGIFKKINGVYEEITSLLAHFYAVCDYTDEDIEPWEYDNAIAILSKARQEITRLFETFERGNTIKNGLPCAIVGRPNVGKSSLLNALLGYERAIVTDEAGTTRDTIESTIQIGGTTLRLIDTAGIRMGESKAEIMGIERSIEAAKDAKLVLCVIDGSQELTPDDFRSLQVAENAENSILVINKSDLNGKDHDFSNFEHIFYISAQTGEGLDKLIEFLGNIVKYNENETLITNARQAGLLQKAASSLAEAENSAKIGQTADAFLFDAENALSNLGEIIGKTPTADILSEIFSKFCVGK